MPDQKIWEYLDLPTNTPGAGRPGTYTSDPGNTVGFLWQEPQQLSAGMLSVRAILGNPNTQPWRGASVYVSPDDAAVTAYQRWWITTHRSIIGESLTLLAASTEGWQAAETVDIDLSDSPGELIETNQAGALLGFNLAVLGNEVISFAEAAVIATNQYRLTGIVRGWFGTTPAEHAIGSRFAMLDHLQDRHLFPDAAEATWYWKAASINVGGREQSLVGIAAQTITLSTYGDAIP